MRVLVTAGGTREPIDDARVIANTSTGRLGARLAAAAQAAGHEVLLLRAETGVAAPTGVRSAPFETSADLAALLERHAAWADAIFQAAAVSDYVPDRSTGKLSSELPELVLRLVRAPKLIDGLRALCPRGRIVGFKLTSGRDEAGRVRAATELLVRARLDLVVVNDAGRIGESDHEVLLVDASGPVGRAEGKSDIADTLVAWLDARRTSAGASAGAGAGAAGCGEGA